MTIIFAPEEYAPQGDAPRSWEIPAFVQHHYGTDDPSLIAGYHLLAQTFDLQKFPDDSGRKQRPQESKFWHGHRVGKWSWNHSRKGNPHLPGITLRAFCASLHDGKEDTRKRAPDCQVTIDRIIAAWHGPEEDKEIIRQYFELKTDPPDLEPDARRARQLEIARMARSGALGKVGEILIPAMLSDKWDHLLVNIVDIDDGRLTITNVTQKREFCDIMNMDRHIVKALGVNPKLFNSYATTYDQLMDRVSDSTARWAPRTDSTPPFADASHEVSISRSPRPARETGVFPRAYTPTPAARRRPASG